MFFNKKKYLEQLLNDLVERDNRVDSFEIKGKEYTLFKNGEKVSYGVYTNNITNMYRGVILHLNNDTKNKGE